MVNQRLRRIMTMIFIFLFLFSIKAFSQCKKNLKFGQSYTIQGISNGFNHYYLNLIIQDIAIAGQQKFQDISLRFDFDIKYTVDQCRTGQIDVSVMPVAIVCKPVIYQGYDISASIKPEKANLVFYLNQQDGFVTDSLVFTNFALDTDSGLYTTMTFQVKDSTSLYNVSFSSAEFYFTKSSYELFRDHLLEIDNYYAASLLADSALVWTRNGFLSENGSKTEMIFRQLELDRLINYISPVKFDSLVMQGNQDLNGLYAKYRELRQLNSRYKAIIKYNRFNSGTFNYSRENELLKDFLDLLDHYYKIAYNSDFHYVNYIEGLSVPEFSNKNLVKLQNVLMHEQGISSHDLRSWSLLFVKALIDRGSDFELSANQLRAMSYYKSAYKIAYLLHLHEYQSVSFKMVEQMTNAVAASYLDISKRTALRENPAMAAKYYHDARGLFSEREIISNEPEWLSDYESWLFKNFEEQVIRNIEMKNFRLSMAYLNEIQAHCLSSALYACPENFNDWMRTTREGLYIQLLDKSLRLAGEEEMPEAEQIYGQALEMRMGAGYRIDKDLREAKLEVTFRQLHYEEFCDEGLDSFEKEAFVSSLYYYNKAEYLEKEGITRPDPGLYDRRQYAARQVILNLLSDGRVKVWANDFQGAENVLSQVTAMLSNYQFASGDTLVIHYEELRDSLLHADCEKITGEFDEIFITAKTAADSGDFIQAYQKYSDAVEMSMDHLKCKINDEQAWYEKIRLEPLAHYQKIENDLDLAVSKPVQEYLNLYQELKKYYNRNKLDKQGVVFIPLFERVIRQKDSAFLTGMLDHYIYLTDYDHALIIMKRFHELNLPSGPIKHQQETLAEKIAFRDAKKPENREPWMLLTGYTGRDKWYRSFAWSYKLTWLKAKKWNIKSWPVFWRK